MDQPWGLSGPQFTGLYIAGFVASVVVVFVVQGVLARIGSRAAGADVRLDVYQAAYVAGGPARVVDTAIAGLALRDQILVARGGRLTAVSGARAFGPVEAAVCQELNPTASRAAVVSRLRRHPVVEAIGDQMRSRGLMFERALPWRLVLLLPVAVWVVGLVRAVNGAHLGRPIGNLTALLLFSGIVTLIVLAARWSVRNRASAAGRFAVRRLREQHQESPVVAAQVAGVAVLGFTALADPALRSALVTSSGSSGDSGSSCGGGGCGGGGGGCGG